MSRNIPIALIQRPAGLDPDKNLEETASDVRAAARNGAKVICTQELFRSQYFCQSEDHRHFSLAESIPGPSTETFAAIAREHGVVIIASLFERRAQGLYHNTAVVLDADGSLLLVGRSSSTVVTILVSVLKLGGAAVH